jgi:4-amino-4-deoxy-L-arabinose transferase-like glycosyltransferase
MHRKYGLIAAIVILAGILRFLGIWHDYPYSFYPDEVHFVKRALSFGSFDFNPHWFHKPAFYMYLLFFEYGIFFVIGKVIGLWGTVSDFAVSYVKNPGPFYIIGRSTTALFSIGSILVAYRVGERHFKEGTGIMAALFLALCFGHVAASQVVKADTPAMFFAVASMFFLLNYLDEKDLKNLVLAAVFAGVGTATKKYPIVMLVPIFVSIFLVHRETGENPGWRLRRMAFCMTVVLFMFYLSYFVSSPYNFLDPTGRRSTFGFINGLYMKIHQLFSGIQVEHPGNFIDQKTSLLKGYVDYFKVLIATSGMGIVISSCAISGFICMLSKINKKVIIFLLFPVIFAVISVFSAPGYAESRHQLPVYPFLAISGGVFIVMLAGSEGLRKKVVLSALLISLVFPLYMIVKRDLEISKQDTRNLAKTWIHENIAPGSKLLINENGPQLLVGKEYLESRLKRALAADSQGQFTAHYGTFLKYQIHASEDSVTYDIDFIRLPWWLEREKAPGVYYATSNYDRDMGNPLRAVGVMHYEFYRENGYEYIIVISNEYDRFLKENSKVARNFPSFYYFYKELFEKGTLVKDFQSDPMNNHGPVVKIFRIS